MVHMTMGITVRIFRLKERVDIHAVEQAKEILNLKDIKRSTNNENVAGNSTSVKQEYLLRHSSLRKPTIS